MSIQATTLCLNMIVKNESRVIIRLLESVYKLLDYYYICDTGSTDNTVELIEQFFKEKNIPGCIIHYPFIDFGFNRTHALSCCNNNTSCDYIILLDADMVLDIPSSLSPNELKSKLVDDMYFIFQGTNDFFYKNCRILRNNSEYSYWGVTHEYVQSPEHAKQYTFAKDIIFIKDMGDGGSKSDKQTRDIRLLLSGLETFPDNDRYTFYLANTYHDIGDNECAIKYYKKRIELGGWYEECWYSYYRIGNCYSYMGDNANAVYYWLKAYGLTSYRIESLYKIVEHYRLEGNHALSYHFYHLADSVRSKMTSWDHLFLEKDVYNFKLDYELSIIGYYCDKSLSRNELIATCMKILANPSVDASISNNVISNFKFYTDTLSSYSLDIMNLHLLSKIGSRYIYDGFVSSTPTMCYDINGNLVIGVRFVNYSIDENGEYRNKDKIITHNVIAVFDSHSWEKKDEFTLNYDKSHDGRYVGLEDLRLFRVRGSDIIHYNANRGIGDGTMVVEHGRIDMVRHQCYNDVFLTYANQTLVEKNWVLFEDPNRGRIDKLYCVYKWFPLTLGVLEKGILTNVTESDTPSFFRFMRGSTNGVIINDEIWFITHTVSYEDRRYYYHCVVVLDANTFELKKYTELMTFEKNPVEYVLGFIYLQEKRNFIIGYSVMDRETRYMVIDRSVIDDKMIICK